MNDSFIRRPILRCAALVRFGSVHDLIHLGLQARAQVSVNIYGMWWAPISEAGVRTALNDPDPDPDPDLQPNADDERREAETVNAALVRRRPKRRSPNDEAQTSGACEIQHDAVKGVERPGAPPHELNETLRFLSR